MSESTTALHLREHDLELCANLLRDDQVIAVPTETVYGLAGNSLCENAVRRIFEVKGRPLVDPLISHFRSAESVFEHVHENTAARRLAKAFWPGPLTLILPKKSTIPDLVTAGLACAGVRVPTHPTFRALLDLLPFPLAAPSANPFGYVSPTKSEHVFRTLGSRIPAVLEGGPCDHGIESTIVDMRQHDRPVILRPGPISAEELAHVLGVLPKSASTSRNGNEAAQVAPGMLTKHYSPKSRVRLLKFGAVSIDELDRLSKSADTALVLQTKPKELSETGSVYWLSEDGDLEIITKNLFDLLQKLELAGYPEIAVEMSPTNNGLGAALNDRLNRAAAD